MSTAAAKTADLTPKQNTKIETLAEAIENLITATCAQMHGQAAGAGTVDKMVQKFESDARAQLRTALKEFVLPVLRIIEGDGRQVDKAIPKSDRVICGACNRDRICADKNCPHWHEAVRNTISPPETEDEFDDGGDNVA